MATIDWLIEQMSVKPQEDGKTDVVISASWRCNAVDGSHNATIYGTASFTLEQSTDFTPYADLTQDQVLAWVWNSGVNKNATELNVTEQIEEKINPPVVVLQLPWAQPVEA